MNWVQNGTMKIANIRDPSISFTSLLKLIKLYSSTILIYFIRQLLLLLLLQQLLKRYYKHSLRGNNAYLPSI